MTHRWEDLSKKYPRLIPAWFGFQCQLGWLRILDDYLAVIDRKMPVSAAYELRQVKEKLGTLRIYDASYGETLSSVTAITDAHRLAEARSLHTCEYCGRRGRFRKRDRYLTVTCDDHAVQHGVMAIPEEPEPRDYRQTHEGWIVYDSDLDAFVETEAPDWA
ncbi:hypothetical protein EGT36_30230 [Agrobacterium sp. FDAARGOS_525]|uniref:hypothetical protein n=1 Tax=Agrobacterium sp. FDAARGOS_525 TaxID=2420311 RepID=UPI000F68A86B|nr:hypothetical protein [Agrobacterium sp. FDAARGOS_525]RSC21468.1 hypothetical protein EGT36_30230 [Agrobacterium sp. FDAARGOS_525]